MGLRGWVGFGMEWMEGLTRNFAAGMGRLWNGISNRGVQSANKARNFERKQTEETNTTTTSPSTLPPTPESDPFPGNERTPSRYFQKQTTIRNFEIGGLTSIPLQGFPSKAEPPIHPLTVPNPGLNLSFILTPRSWIQSQ